MNPSLTPKDLKERIKNTADGSIYSVDENGGFNYNHYYYPQSGLRIPLLGTGRVDVLAAIKGTPQGTAPGQTLNRVDDICGVMSNPSGRNLTPMGFLLVLLVLPFLLSGILALFNRRSGTAGWI
jgi:hypothetical protein